MQVTYPAESFVSLSNWLDSSEGLARWRGFAVAVTAIVVTVIVRLVLEVIFTDQAPTYLIFLVPIFVAAVFGGLGPGIFATLLAWFVAHFFFIEPSLSFKSASADLVVAGVFLAEGLGITLIGWRLRHAVSRVLDRERELAASETRLLMAQAAARIATYEWDPVSGRANWSDNAEEIVGMEPGSFAGTFDDALRTVVDEDRHLIAAAADHLLQAGTNELEYRILDTQGLTRWIHATGTLVAGNPTEDARVVGVMMDITERRRASEHSAFLGEALAELTRTLDYRAGIVGVATLAVPRFADMSAVVLVRNGVFPGEVVALRHRDPTNTPLLESLQSVLEEMPDRPGLVAQAIRSATPMFLSAITPEQLDRMALSSAHLEALRNLNVSAAMCIPLSARGNVLGGFIFAQDGSRTFDAADFTVATELGRRASLAIENALLLEQSFDREGEISRANEALQLIADAGVALNQSLDLSETLNALTTLVVPRFADVCTITLADGSSLEQAAIATVTPEVREAMDALAKAQPVDRDLLESAAQVLHSDRPIFLPQIPPPLAERLATLAEAADGSQAFTPHSMIIMPLSARSQTLGVMSFIRLGESPAFDRESLSVAGQIARRTAVAADNARLYQEARRANDAKDEFLGMMSHELRTPITVIHGGARVLRSRADVLDEETRTGLLGDIERESERLSRMLENLLALARAELDREVLVEPVLLQRLLPRLIDSLNLDTRDVSYTNEGDPPAVSAEQGYIEHIVRNLVGNAVKYSPPDSPIQVVLSNHGDGAAIRVLDRGFGVSQEEAPRIFERFYRSDRTSRLAGGAGLGLAVCKRLVEAMSGEIWATPREEGGLEVGFSLPPYIEENMDV